MIKRPLLSMLTATCAALVASCSVETSVPSGEPPTVEAVSNGKAEATATLTRQETASSGRELPTVDNTEVDRTDPSDVARKFILLTTTFNPGYVVDERNEVERGYPLTTSNYRRNNRPLEKFSGPTVRIRSWYNQGTDDDDPVVHVSSVVQWLTRPQMPAPDAKRAQRRLRSIQTPETQAGRKLEERVLDYQLTLVKQDNGQWAVDAKSVTRVEQDAREKQ